MHRLLQDLRFGLRTFLKAPGFTAVAIVVLGLGIGANSAIFTIVNAMLFQPLSGQAGELVGLYSHDRTRPDSYRGFSYPNFADIREQSGVFEGVMAHTFAMVGEPAGETTRRTFAELVSSNYFTTLGVSLAAGRPFSLDEERPGARVPVAIVSYPRWQQANLDPAFIGSAIRINAEDFTVIGVAPEGFTGTMALVAPEIYLPLGMFEAVANDFFQNNRRGLADRANPQLVVAGRLNRHLGQELVNGRLEALSRHLEEAYPGENKNQLLTISPLSRMSTSTSPRTDGGLGAFTALLLGLSGTVLVIACLNIANMLLARGAARRKEVAVRLALGASRSRIVRQLMTESVALAFTGAAVGLVLAYWATRVLVTSFKSVLPMAVSFDPRPDAAVLLVTTGFAALSTIVFGLGPAVKLSRRDLVIDLKDLGSDSASLHRRFGARNLMVVGQVAMSLALLVAGGIFGRAALSAAAADPGYRYDRLFHANVDPSFAAIDEPRGRTIYRSVLGRIRAMPRVRSASLTSTMPFGDIHEGERVERLGGPKQGQAPPVASAAYRILGADYFATLGLRMLRGREFTAAEEESDAAPPVAIIDEVLARRLFGDEDPLGQMIRITRRPEASRQEPDVPMQVIGLAPPITDELIDREPDAHLYVPFGRHYRSNMHLHVSAVPGEPEAAVVEALRSELRAAAPSLPILSLSSMEAFHERSLELWALKAGGRLFTGLGLVGLLLAVVGLYGVKAYLVAQRTREIGIRMALGATTGDVLRMVLRDGVALTAAGLAVGVPLAALVSYAFTKVFVDLGGFDPVLIGGATLVLSAAAIAASVIPARRAAKVVPLTALRTE